jgi:hypothetical protein
MEKYFFNVTMDPETKKPVVMKMLKPKMPTVESRPDPFNPDGPPEYFMKTPEMTSEETELYAAQNKMIQDMMEKSRQKMMADYMQRKEEIEKRKNRNKKDDDD